MTSNIFLSGERLHLKPLSEEALQGNYVSWLNDPDVCRFNSHHVFPYTLAQAKAYIQSAAGDKSALVLAIHLNETGEHIGNISLQRIDLVSRSAEFAILMGEKQHWGKGYSKEAALLIVWHGFGALNLHRIACGTTADNLPMQKLAAYMGMREEGRRRQAQFNRGEYVDILEYGVLREEFLRKFPQESLEAGVSA